MGLLLRVQRTLKSLTVSGRDGAREPLTAGPASVTERTLSSGSPQTTPLDGVDEPTARPIEDAGSNPWADTHETPAVAPRPTVPITEALAARGRSLTRGEMVRKLLHRVSSSVLVVLLVGAIPGLILLVTINLFLQMATVPPWFRETALAAAVGGLLAVILATGISRAGVKVKWKGGRLLIVISRKR